MDARATLRDSIATDQNTGSDPYEYSLVVGGPLFQLFRRAHLSGDALDLVRRRVVVIPLLAWGPLLVLSALYGQAWGRSVAVSFLADIEVHCRLLLALPLLIAAELVVHRRIRGITGEFVRRGLIADVSRPRFDAAIPSALRLRNSIWAEVLLIAAVYLAGVFYVWPRFIALTDVSTWYAVPYRGHSRLSPAGWWFVFVSLPLFQFILLRWYFRLFIWLRLLWQVARCDLELIPTHPDRVGGLGFLDIIPIALAPFLAAHGVAVAGLIANQIFFHGGKLPDFAVEVAVIVVFLFLVVLAPLLIFAPRLARLKRTGLRDYGELAQRYVRQFDNKWIHGSAPPDEPLIGNADIQSLADLGNSFGLVQGIRLIPISRQAVIQLAVITLLPIAPLLLTMISMKDLIKRLLQVVL